MNRKDFRPTNNSSSGISDKDRKLIRKNKADKYFVDKKGEHVNYIETKDGRLMKVSGDREKLVAREEKLKKPITQREDNERALKANVISKKSYKKHSVKADIIARQKKYGDNPSLDIDKKDAKALGGYYMPEKKPYFVVGTQGGFLGRTIFQDKSFDNKTDAENFLKSGNDRKGKVLTRKEYAHYRVKEIRGDRDTGKW